VIKPTVGRVVWFYPKDRVHSHQPHAAIVTSVHGDRCVNLAVFMPNGVPMSHPPTSVTLVQEGDAIPEGACYCCWMPHQLGQAKAEAARPI
jgi:hypothetical protein